MKKYFYFLAVCLIACSCGAQSAKKSKAESESKYGDWKICDFVDDFDEPTGERLVYCDVIGTFSTKHLNREQAKIQIRFFRYFFKDLGRYRVLGTILLDKFCNGTQDDYLYYEALSSVKIIDKPNHKLFLTNGLKFHEQDSDEYFIWPDILRMTPSTYDFVILGDTEYRFSVNTENLELALKDAGILEGVVDEW